MKITTCLIPLVAMFSLIGLSACNQKTGTAEEQDPAEIAIGERLFLETRFAQAYYDNQQKADPALEYTLTMDLPLRGPFAGKTMNCRACHLVDEHVDTENAGMRSYADFTHNSPIPERNDGHHLTPRNSMSLVNINIAAEHGVLFHFDGEFNSMEDLVRGTLTGRNYGWLADEAEQAIKHIARIIREDDGKDELGQEFGGSYRRVLAATDQQIPAELVLPAEYRLDVDKASDRQIFDAVAKLIAAYVDDLGFVKDEQGNYTDSPYDHFLELNNLPRQPVQDETSQQYAKRLLTAVEQLDSAKFITDKQASFKFHKQTFAFGEKELTGMKLFFGRGNCVACHAAPHFSDFGFHNTGLTQVNYDEAHGDGSFTKLDIPNLVTRNLNYDAYLPATANHPKASGRYRSIVDIDKPGNTDLGLWNVFANPDKPAPQAKLKQLLCKQTGVKTCTAEQILPYTIAAFKTPVLRDLGHSNPYMHNGQFNSLHEAVSFYITSSALAKQDQLVNADPMLRDINITAKDIEPLVAFLNALNEDYN